MTNPTTGEQIERINAILGRAPETTADKLAEVSRDLAHLADVAARIVGTDSLMPGALGMVTVTVYTDRATFDKLPGYCNQIRDRFHDGAPMDFDAKSFGLVSVYCREDCQPVTT